MEQPERWRAFDVLGHLNAVTAVNHLAEAFALSVTAGGAAPDALRTRVATLTQDGLAKLVGVARATLQHAFDEVAQANAIRTGYRSVTSATRGACAVCQPTIAAPRHHSIMAADASLGILPMLRRAQHGRRLSR